MCLINNSQTYQSSYMCLTKNDPRNVVRCDFATQDWMHYRGARDVWNDSRSWPVDSCDHTHAAFTLYVSHLSKELTSIKMFRQGCHKPNRLGPLQKYDTCGTDPRCSGHAKNVLVVQPNIQRFVSVYPWQGLCTPAQLFSPRRWLWSLR